MAATHAIGVYGNAVGVTTPLEMKMAQLGLIVKTAANTIRAGLFWDGNPTIVSGKANMSLDIRAFTAALSRGATAGAVLLANDAVLNLTKDTTGANLVAPGSNSVYWNVFVWQREFSIDGTDSNPVIGVLVGTPAASPAVPALTAFPGAVSLATVLVPSGTTATNSGTTITQTAPFTACAGGTVPFRNTTERDAGTYQEGQLGWLIDSDTLQSYNGTTWTSVNARAELKYTGAGQSIPNGTNTVVTYDGTDYYNNLPAFTYNRAAGTLTCTRAGTYEFDGLLIFASSATGIRQISLSKALAATPTTFVIQSLVTLTAASGAFQIGGVWKLTLAVGDVIEMLAAQSSGGALNVTGVNLGITQMV